MDLKKLVIILVFLAVIPISIHAYDAFKTSGMEVNVVTKPIPFDSEQRIYTPICLSNCHLVLNVTGVDVKDLYSTDLTSYKSQTKGIDDYSFQKIEYLKNETYPDIECISYNVSIRIEERVCLATKPIVRWRLTWKPLDSKLLDIKGNYYIDIIYYRKPSLISAAVDIVPVIKSVPVDSMAWFNSSFTKRKNTTLTYTGLNSTLTNGNIYLNVTYDSDMQSDYDDLRFTNEAGIELDYWREAYNANYWLGYVEVDSITNSSTKTISMYYGYAAATSVSNCVNTFYFCDDFEDNDATDWVASMSTQSTYRFNNSASSYGFSAPNGAEQYKTITNIPANTLMSYYWYVFTCGAGDAYWYNAIRTSASANLLIWKTNAYLVYSLPAGWTPVGSLKFEAGKWHKLSVSGSPAGTWNYTLDFVNGTTQTATGIASTASGIVNRFMVGDYGGSTNYGDAVFIANYVDKIITYSFGSEETGGTPTTTTLYINGGVGNITYQYTSVAGANMTAITDIAGMYVALYVNGTLSDNHTTSVTNTTIFPVGVYNITAVNYGNSSYYSSSATLWLNITKASTGMELWLDGTQANRSYSYLPDIPVNSTGVINITGLPVSIYVNNTLKASGTTYKEYDEIYGYGAWNITSVFSGNTNYTGSFKTWWLNITKGTNLMYFSLSNSSYSLVANNNSGGWFMKSGTEYGGNEFLHLVYPNGVNSTGSCSGGTYNLSINNTLNITTYLNSSFVSGYTPASSFEFYCNGNANYSTNQSYLYVNITKGTPNLTIITNGSNPATAGAIINLTCLSNGIITGLENFYNDTGAITNPFIINTTALMGTYNYTCNVSGSGNYSAESKTFNQTVILIGGLSIDAVYDEKTLTPLMFNLSIYNSSYSQTINNIYNYNNNSVKGDLTFTITANNYIPRNYYVFIDPNSSYYMKGYLLRSDEGVYISYWGYSVPHPTGEALAYVQVYRFLNSSWEDIAESKADVEGKGSLFLDPYTTYLVNSQTADASLTYNLSSYSANPSFILKLAFGGGTSGTNITWLFTNLNYFLVPEDIYLRHNVSNNISTFNYSISVIDNTIQWMQLRLRYWNGTYFYSSNDSTHANGTSISVNLNYTLLNGTITAETYFKRIGYNLYSNNRTYLVWSSHSAIPDALTGLQTSGLSSPVQMLIALFVSFGIAMIVNRMFRTGSGLIFLGVLSIFTLYGFFSAVFLLGLFLIEIGFLMFREVW